MCGHEEDGAGVPPVDSLDPDDPGSVAFGSIGSADAPDEYVSRCPACGDVIDYCQGHGEMGDPAGRAILDAHDAGDHSGCHEDGCDERGPRCDVCGRAQGDSPNVTDADQPGDWNGETGNHETCEDLARRDRDPVEVYGTPEHEAWLVELERRGDL